MRLFNKRKQAVRVNRPWVVSAEEQLSGYQKRFADGLSRKTQHWNRASWIVALTTFIVLFGGGCLLLLLKAIIHF